LKKKSNFEKKRRKKKKEESWEKMTKCKKKIKKNTL
jgi:hypothetical protein